MNQRVFELVEDLFQQADRLQEKVYQIVQDNDLYRSGIGYDFTVINNDRTIQTYKRDRYKRILNYQSRKMDTFTLERVLEHRIKMVKCYRDSASKNNIGTLLNGLRELYNDVLLDFERFKIGGESG